MGVLGRYLPNFRRIVGQMQHDLFHVYTVDQHILMVVRNLRRFTMTEHAHEYPFCSQLIANFARPLAAVRRRAVPRHRQGPRRRPFAARAARMPSILPRPRHCDAKTRELVVFLVEQHLTMSQVAQKQDLSDPDVIRDFAATGQGRAPPDRAVPADGGRHPRHQPQGLERLEGASCWKTCTASRCACSAASRIRPTANCACASRKRWPRCACSAWPANAHEALWHQLDVVYFLRHDASDIAWQTRCLHDRLEQHANRW